MHISQSVSLVGWSGIARGRVQGQLRGVEESLVERSERATAAPEGSDYVREQRSIERSEPWALALQERLLYGDRIPGSRTFPELI